MWGSWWRSSWPPAMLTRASSGSPVAALRRVVANHLLDNSLARTARRLLAAAGAFRHTTVVGLSSTMSELDSQVAAQQPSHTSGIADPLIGDGDPS